MTTIGNSDNELYHIIQLNDDITKIPSNSFKGCSALKEIKIPQTVTTICESSFEGCSSLKKIIIPSSVRTIESNSFKGCSQLEEIRIDCQTEVHPSSFENCESLNRLIISSSKVTSEKVNQNESSIFFKSNINPTIFNNILIEEQENLLKIINNIIINKTKEEKIKKIVNFLAYLTKEKQISKNSPNNANESFVQIVKNDEQILIKSNMTEILNENQIFNKEEFLNQVNNFECIFIEVKYPSSVFESIYNKLMNLKKSKIPKLKIAIFITGIEATDQHFHGNSDISYVTLDKCVTNIQSRGSDGSFDGCESLEYISIPSSVTQIGDNSFWRCSSLTQIIIQQENKSRFKFLENGLLIYKSSNNGDYDTLVWAKKNIKTVNIPSSIKIIKSGAFERCASLTQITIPSSVTQIGNNAFNSCSSLTQITIPSSVTQIGNYTFSFCPSLTQITIPRSLNVSGTGIGSKVRVIKV